MKKEILTVAFLLIFSFAFSQENEEDIFGLPSEKKINRHSIGFNIPMFYNMHRNYNFYYEYLTFEGDAGFQFPIKYFSDNTLLFRGIFTGCDFVHHVTDHFSSFQFLYGGGINPGFFIWDPNIPGPYKRQYSFAVVFGIKVEINYMIVDQMGVGLYLENNWVGRLDGYKQSSPPGLNGGGTMNVGIKGVYRF